MRNLRVAGVSGQRRRAMLDLPVPRPANVKKEDPEWP